MCLASTAFTQCIEKCCSEWIKFFKRRVRKNPILIWKLFELSRQTIFSLQKRQHCLLRFLFPLCYPSALLHCYLFMCFSLLFLGLEIIVYYFDATADMSNGNILIFSTVSLVFMMCEIKLSFGSVFHYRENFDFFDIYLLYIQFHWWMMINKKKVEDIWLMHQFIWILYYVLSMHNGFDF